jgi:6,7-dimethyl-8-ribityllumazine synthase
MKSKICIVQSIYNEDITEKLCSSASKALTAWRIKHSIEKVPGAFEIPVTIARLAKKYDGFIAVGCIIKGKTANFDLISNAITNGIMQISINEKKPIGNAIITSFNKEQCFERLDKGKEAAIAVIKVLKIKNPNNIDERFPDPK